MRMLPAPALKVISVPAARDGKSMGMMTAKNWKAFYAREREELGVGGLEKLIERAPPARLTADGTIIFPHTRLSASGELIAAAARAVVDSPYDQIIALGVLHGAREQDAQRVRAARSGGA